MRWTSRSCSPPIAGVGILVVVSALLVSGAAPEKRLSVYSVAANYSLPLVEREGHDYVGLLELLEPLGAVSAKVEAQRWRIRYNKVEGEFNVGRTHARVGGRDVDLSAKFLLENRRGLVPVVALSSMLPRILGGPVTLREDSGRLFIGSVATHFTASLAGDNAPRLIFNFTSPVNPSVSTEPGALHMTFSREPVVAPASPTLTFGSKTMPSATYSEGNGVAVITVKATVPVMASFSNDGRAVTIAPMAVVAQSPPPVAAPSAASSPAETPKPPAANATPVARRYFAIIDASHGGEDHGEALSSTLLEKDITVALARSLRQQLESRGISALVLRDSDANLTLDQRAILANTSHGAIYIAVHAASSGHGVRVYTAMLPYGGDDRGPFRSWDTSQHASLPLSQAAAAEVAAELQKRQIPVRTLSAPLRPLNNVLAAALAVEVAPQGSDPAQLTAPDYQELIAGAVATAVASTRDRLGAAP